MFLVYRFRVYMATPLLQGRLKVWICLFQIKVINKNEGGECVGKALAWRLELLISRIIISAVLLVDSANADRHISFLALVASSLKWRGWIKWCLRASVSGAGSYWLMRVECVFSICNHWCCGLNLALGVMVIFTLRKLANAGDRSKVRCCKERYCIGPAMSGPWIKANRKWSNKRWQEWTSTF